MINGSREEGGIRGVGMMRNEGMRGGGGVIMMRNEGNEGGAGNKRGGNDEE